MTLVLQGRFFTSLAKGLAFFPRQVTVSFFMGQVIHMREGKAGFAFSGCNNLVFAATLKN